jgi:hypothetical protein
MLLSLNQGRHRWVQRIDREGIAELVKTGDRPMIWIISSGVVRSDANGWSDAGARRCVKDGSAPVNGAVWIHDHTIQNRDGYNGKK